MIVAVIRGKRTDGVDPAKWMILTHLGTECVSEFFHCTAESFTAEVAENSRRDRRVNRLCIKHVARMI